MIPPDFSLNAPHSTEEEMGRLSSSRKVVEGFGRKVGKPVGGREVVGIGCSIFFMKDVVKACCVSL